MDEPSIQGQGQWSYLYRAVAKHGQPMAFLLTAHRDTAAALRLLKKAIRRTGLPETRPSDGSDAQAAAIPRDNEAHGTAIAIRQGQSLPNVVAQDHRAVKRVPRPMLGLKAFEAAQDPRVGIALMHRIKTRQLRMEAGDEGRPAAALCYSLAA
jgi:transposase-like protein